MSIVEGYTFEPMVGDPDDHRPETRWALLVDPGGPEGRVDGFALIAERIAPGDRVWLRYLERNPASGTEADGPQRGATYDVRTGDVTFDS